MSQLMLPSDANPAGNVHGGSIVKLVDSAAGVVATRHCRTRVVTARIDEMSFLEPVFVGNVVTIKASVNDTGRTSLEVGVRVEAEELTTGETRHVASAYLVFVALDEAGHPTAVPPITAETADEKRRQAAARARRARRQRPPHTLESQGGTRAGAPSQVGGLWASTPVDQVG
jgi:acyl-CoA hydrolase